MSGKMDGDLAQKVAAGLSINIPGQKAAAPDVPKKTKKSSE